MKRAALLILVGLSLLASGCSMVGDPSLRGDVTGTADPEATPPTLLVRNQTNRTVCYFAGEERDMARLDFVFESCREDAPTLAPGQTTRVPYEEISFYDEGDERVWIAWRVKGSPGTSYSSFEVSLR